MRGGGGGGHVAGELEWLRAVVVAIDLAEAVQLSLDVAVSC